jgi:hypothetical protein
MLLSIGNRAYFGGDFRCCPIIAFDDPDEAGGPTNDAEYDLTASTSTQNLNVARHASNELAVRGNECQL